MCSSHSAQLSESPFAPTRTVGLARSSLARMRRAYGTTGGRTLCCRRPKEADGAGLEMPPQVRAGCELERCTGSGSLPFRRDQR